MWLCHVKNLSSWFISDPSTLFKIWDKINVKVFGIDNDGKIQLKKE
jgi:predicted RNA-binding protein with RPS1 domain